MLLFFCFRKTIQERLERYFHSRNGNRRWIEQLQNTVTQYNNTVHSSIKMKPIDVTPDNEDRLFKEQLARFPRKDRKKPKFSVGDLVRLPNKEFVKKRSAFKKGARANWSKQIFKIVKAFRGRKYPRYSVANSRGEIRAKRYYEQQLNLVKRFADR